MDKKKRVILIVVIIIAAAVAACGFFWLKSHNTKSQEKQNTSATVVPWDVEIPEEMPQEAGKILLPGYSSMEMKAGTVEQTVSIGNPSKNNCYKVVNPQSVKQHDGSYGVILAGDPSLVQGKATIIVELSPKSHTVERVVTPENSGAIQCKNETARYGDTVSFTAQPANGYYLADVRICNKNGDVLDVPELKKGGGSFVMPDEDVVIKANFIPFTYSIQTKDSDHVKLLATDENGNHIASAQKGTQVALHYTKTPWTAYEQISVYRENEYNTPNAQPIATWTAKLPKDSEAQPMTFEMPGSGVIIESVMMDEGTYKISKDIEGNGSVYVKNLESGNVDSARQGEKIFVSASAQRGWSLDREQTVVADAQGQKLDVGAQDHGRYVSFAMPAQELNIKAVFTQNAYRVTVKGISEESISITDETGSAVDLNAVHYDDVLKIKADTGEKRINEFFHKWGCNYWFNDISDFRC